MSEISESLLQLADKLDALAAKADRTDVKKVVASLNEVISRAAGAFCGSWIGYHARVYYAGLNPPPPGARFSPEWGLMDRHFNDDTRGDWREYSHEELYNALKDQADGLSFNNLVEFADEIGREVVELREELVSFLTALSGSTDDTYLQRLLERVQHAKLLSVNDFIAAAQPKGSFFSRDSAAYSAGLQVPPHINLLGQVNAIESRFALPKILGGLARQGAAHLDRKRLAGKDSRSIGTKVFIGHGRSLAWRELKDFIQDRLDLEWDEFNRVPVAGVTNITRLSQMLDEAAIAFLVMTAEDETKDGKLHARMNVVHEAGLFQGRLGFTKAVIVLEEGCEEFSNVQGLGQIRFPAGKIKAAFEEVRQVLEREGMLESE